MGSFLRSALSALPIAASSPLAMAGYVITLAAWLVIVIRVKRNKQVLNNLDKFSKHDRLEVLRAEMGVVRLKSGLSPDQYLRSRIHLYYLIGFGMICLLLVLLFAIAASRPGKKKGVASVDITLSQPQAVSAESTAVSTIPPSDSIQIGARSHVAKDRFEAGRHTYDALSAIRYTYERVENKVFIKPVVPYLSELQNGGVIDGAGVSLARVYPELSVKVVNNTEETIYLTEVVVTINSRSIDKEPILSLGSETWDNLTIDNEGYGNIVDPKLSFGVAEAKKCKQLDPRTAPTKEHLSLNTFSDSTDVSMKPYVYVPPFEERKGNTVIFRTISNAHACVYGKIQYTTEEFAERTVSFKTTMWVGTPGIVEYQTSVAASAAYEVKLETGLAITAGNPIDKKRIPISQSIKPGEADHFTILVVPDKSSRFDLSFDFQTADGKVLHSRDVILNTIVPKYWLRYDIAEIKQLK